MRTIKLIVFVTILMLAFSLQAQLSVHVNIGTPPQWGPEGYSGVRYYYLPDIESYYDVPSSMFIYYSGNRWVHSRYLPGRYRNYDLYHGYKVVMNDYRGNEPYYHFREYKMKYGKGYRGEEHRNIGERHENRERGYDNQPNRMESRGNERNHDQRGDNHDKHDNKGRGNENGHDQGHNKDHGKD